MSNNNMISDTKKQLLAHKEKLLNDIKEAEKDIEDFKITQKNKVFYPHQADSSDSEDDFPFAIDMGPSDAQLKAQQAMMKTCLQATEELTDLDIIQSDVNLLIDDPEFEGEGPVTEPGTWREVTAECRMNLVPFSITFFFHTPYRKFAARSFRGLRVVPIKSAHELELSNSVLPSLKLPSDAVEVLRSYAAAYRSRRTTLARLADTHTGSWFMEPHADGGLVLKCAGLLEVSWRLYNKLSPVAPFHHKMKFNFEFMEKSYVTIITQAVKQLQDPAIKTDERTSLLSKIIATCLEARGTMDPESDLESKTTERDNDIDKRDSESEKRDSEVMAPPKTLPKKIKQKNKKSLPNIAQKTTLDDENGDSGATTMKNDAPEAKKSIVDANNTRKTKINDVANEGGKKRKIDKDNKVASGKNDKEAGTIGDGNAILKNVKEAVDKTGQTKSKNMKESASTDKKNSNAKTKVTKEAGDGAVKNTNAKEKTKALKKPATLDSKAKSKNKIIKETNKDQKKTNNDKPTEINTKEIQNKDSAAINKVVKEPINAIKVRNKVNKAEVIRTKEANNNPEGMSQNKNNINKIDHKAKNTDKENGGKVSKIPQKTITTIGEGSLKKMIRKIPSKLKTTSQKLVEQKMVESTNIPRLLKKPAPKTK